MFSVAIIFGQIVMRYIFSSSLYWSEELARYLFLWQIWLGTSFAVKEHKHLRIEVFKDFLKTEKSKNIFELIALLIWLGFTIFLTIKGVELTKMLFVRHQVSPAMRFPMAYAYASVPVGCALMSFRLLGETIKTINKIKKCKVA
jgi:TRAP-type C4-dicarboxylate transport system permease small subunit